MKDNLKTRPSGILQKKKGYDNELWRYFGETEKWFEAFEKELQERKQKQQQDLRRYGGKAMIEIDEIAGENQQWT